MTRYTVGCVPYANAIPLVAWFEQLGDESPVKVLYDVPSRLPAMLESGRADAILVSSVDAFLVPDRRMAESVCIGSHGPVKSVRLFSKVPPSKIRSLALDQSSMTSNRLVQILLEERYGVRPTTHQYPPDQEAMLRDCDACVLIGDIGMTASSEGLHVLDLGEEWMRLTGKPFVWAAWIGNERLTPDLALLLNTSPMFFGAGRNLMGDESLIRPILRAVKPRDEVGLAEEMESRRKVVLDIGLSKEGWTESMLRDYFFEVMVYRMDEFVLSGLREFQKMLLKHGFDDCIHFPEIVTVTDAP